MKSIKFDLFAFFLMAFSAGITAGGVKENEYSLFGDDGTWTFLFFLISSIVWACDIYLRVRRGQY